MTIIAGNDHAVLDNEALRCEILGGALRDSSRYLRVRDALKAYEANLELLESEKADGVSVKAKNGKLQVELPCSVGCGP